MASLDSILRQIGCLNRRDIVKAIDEIVNNNLASEREVFLSRLTELVSNDTAKFEQLCSRCERIAEKHQMQDINLLRGKVSMLRTNAISSVSDPVVGSITDILISQLQQTTKIRGDVELVKASIMNTISSFLSDLSKTRQSLKNAAMRSVHEANLKRDQLEIQLEAQKAAAKKREQLVAKMQATIDDLNEQVVFLKRETVINKRVAILEKQLAEKNKVIEELKRSSDQTIEQLEQELEEKIQYVEEQRKMYNQTVFELERRIDQQISKFRKSSGDQDDQIDALEAQIAERDELIERQRRSAESQISQLQSIVEDQKLKLTKTRALVKSQNEQIDELNASLSNAQKEITRQSEEITIMDTERSMMQGSMTMAELDDLREENQEKDEEIEQLKSEVQRMTSYSKDLDELRGTYLKKTQELDDLRKQTELIKKKSVEIEEDNRELSSTIQSLKLQLSHSESEKSALQSDIDHALVIGKIRKDKVKRLKHENEELRNNLSQVKRKAQEHELQLSELRSVSEDSNIESTYLRQQLALIQSEAERNAALLESTRQQLANASNAVAEKTASIEEMLELDAQKTKEIEHLQGRVAQLQKDEKSVKSRIDLIDRSNRIEEQDQLIKKQEEQLRSLDRSLCQMRASHKSMSMKTQEQEITIRDLNLRLEESKRAIAEGEAEIKRMTTLVEDITQQRNDVTDQYESSVFSMKKNADAAERRLKEEKNMKQEIEDELRNAKNEIAMLRDVRDSLKTDNIKLKAEKELLEQSIENEVTPLRRSNDQLRSQNTKLAKSKQKVLDELHKLENDYHDLKRSSEITISLLEKRVEALSGQLSKARNAYDENFISLEHHFDQLNSTLQGATSANQEYASILDQLGVLFDADNCEAILQKASETHDNYMRIREEFVENRRLLNQRDGEIMEMKDELQNITSDNDQLRANIEECKAAIESLTAENQSLRDEAQELELELSNEREEHETTRDCYNELSNDVASIKEIIEFDSIDHLKDKIEKLMIDARSVDDKTQKAQTSVAEIGAKMEKLSKENEDYRETLERQANDLVASARAQKELKLEIVKLTKDHQEQIAELEARIKELADEKRDTERSLVKLHEVLPFNTIQDLYTSFIAFITKKDKLIDDLQHAKQKLEVLTGANQQNIDQKIQFAEEMQKQITQLNGEKIILKSEKDRIEIETSSFSKTFNEIKTEYEALQKWVELMQSQLAAIIPFSSMDELPTIVCGLKEENSAQKQLLAAESKKVGEYKKQNAQLERELDRIHTRVLQLEQERVTFDAQKKKKEILDSQLYGVSSVEELPARFADLKQSLEDTTAKLNEVTGKYHAQKRALLETKQELFAVTGENSELKAKYESLQKRADQMETSNGKLEKEINEINEERDQSLARISRLEKQGNDLEEKTRAFERMMSQIKHVIHVDSPESLVTVIQQMKTENDKSAETIQTSQNQVQELLSTLSDLILDKRVTLPISISQMISIKQYLSDLSANSERYQQNAQFVIQQAQKYGFSGNEVSGALTHIQLMLSKGNEAQLECAKSREQLRIAESELSTFTEKAKAEARGQVHDIQAQLEQCQAKLETSVQVRSSLIHLKAGESYDEALLRQELTKDEIEKIGLREA